MKNVTIKPKAVGNSSNNAITTRRNKYGYMPLGVKVYIALPATETEFRRVHGDASERAAQSDINAAMAALLDEIIRPEYAHLAYYADINKSFISFPDDSDKETAKHAAARSCIAEGKKHDAAAARLGSVVFDTINQAAVKQDMATLQRLIEQYGADCIGKIINA